jgi:hypothetical protein
LYKVLGSCNGYAATDLNNFQGTQTVGQAAKTNVKYATLDNEGGTGRYFKVEGENAW